MGWNTLAVAEVNLLEVNVHVAVLVGRTKYLHHVHFCNVWSLSTQLKGWEFFLLLLWRQTGTCSINSISTSPAISTCQWPAVHNRRSACSGWVVEVQSFGSSRLESFESKCKSWISMHPRTPRMLHGTGHPRLWTSFNHGKHALFKQPFKFMALKSFLANEGLNRLIHENCETGSPWRNKG
jgi:hypothetical protein